MEDRALGEFAVDSCLYNPLAVLVRCALHLGWSKGWSSRVHLWIRMKAKLWKACFIKGHLYIQNKLALSPSDRSIYPCSHQSPFNNKTTLPWSHASIYCNTNAEKKDNTPSPCQSSHICVCTHGENKGSRWDGERKNCSSDFTKPDTRTAHVVLRVQDDFMMRQKRTKSWVPLFSIWILFDVAVDVSTKENTPTMHSGLTFFSPPWTKTRRGRRAEARPCLCL